MTSRIDEFFDKVVNEGSHYDLFSAFNVDDISMRTFTNMKEEELFYIGNKSVYKFDKDWIIITNIKTNTYSFIFLHKRRYMIKSKDIVTGKYSIFIGK